MLFHWFERWAWRVAMLLPIYQNCTTTHWKNGHDRFPVLGLIIHYVAAAWGLGFFVLQVLCCDCVGFFSFLVGGQVKTLFELFGVENPSLDSFLSSGYYGGLCVIGATYLFLLVGGFNSIDVTLQATVLENNKDSGHGIGSVVKEFLAKTLACRRRRTQTVLSNSKFDDSSELACSFHIV